MTETFSVGVRDHIMIAHSLAAETFGPARNLHGATYVVDAEISAQGLRQDNTVIDIALLTGELKQVLSDINYKNLDEHDAMNGHITTTEYVARHIHSDLAGRLVQIDRSLCDAVLSITLHESHVAWARYQAEIGKP